MRVLLLALAVFYAWLPTGLCACKLQAIFFPPVIATFDDTPPAPPDDDDGPNDCHCTGAKPLCVTAAVATLTDDAASMIVPVPDDCGFVPTVDFAEMALIPPFHHGPKTPLYLTLCTLRI